MAAEFNSVITDMSYFGDKKIVFGTYESTGGGTGGDIKTGLTNCEAIFLQSKGSAIEDAPVVNETFPVSGGDVTIVTIANGAGTFIAFGY